MYAATNAMIPPTQTTRTATITAGISIEKIMEKADQLLRFVLVAVWRRGTSTLEDNCHGLCVGHSARWMCA
jgi:hypothetical protein